MKKFFEDLKGFCIESNLPSQCRDCWDTPWFRYKQHRLRVLNDLFGGKIVFETFTEIKNKTAAFWT
jgi:hypothetical protein